MKKRSRLARYTALRKEERGAEAVEFAFIGPLLFFVMLGIFYVLFLAAAQVSVARSASVGVRYAAIKDKDLGRYPTAADVNSNVLNRAFLFASGDCTTDTGKSTGLGAGTPNAPIMLSVSCTMSNPAAQAVNGIRNALWGSGETTTTIQLTADARARRE